MPQWTLNAHQRQLLASCIEIGAEGAADNHTEVGGDNSQEDLELIARIIEELQESNADETEVTITPVPSIANVIDDIEDDGDDPITNLNEGIAAAQKARGYA